MAMLPVKGDAQELPLAEDLQPMVQVYMDRFPESDLRDLYKYCFQDFFGPEHLISDSLGAVNYIVYELSHSDESDWKQPLFFYPLGLMGNYVRVDINYVKQGSVKKFVIVDAGMTDLIRPALYDAHHKIVNLTSDAPEETYDVVGPICESSDVFDKDIKLNGTKRGDLIAMLSAGAYGEIMASGYNCRQLPKGYTSDEL